MRLFGMLVKQAGKYKGAQNAGAKSRGRINIFTVAPKICGSSVWSLLHVAILGPGILRLFLNFQKICLPPFFSTFTQIPRWYPDHATPAAFHVLSIS